MSALKDFFFHETSDEFEAAGHIQVLPEYAEPSAGDEEKQLSGPARENSENEFDDSPDSVAILVCLHDS